jgi:hypothetical protein
VGLVIFILQTRDMSQASLYSWLVSLEWVRAWFLVFWDGEHLIQAISFGLFILLKSNSTRLNSLI